MTVQTLFLRYVSFAVVATVANLATQRIVLMHGESGLHFTAAVGAGTIVGLVIKYVLDKRWIFYDLEAGLKSHSRRFSLYTAMGLFSTLIFWGTEAAFWWLWGTEMMREIGAILGLAVGYVIKYRLDRKFVFSDSFPPVVK